MDFCCCKRVIKKLTSLPSQELIKDPILFLESQPTLKMAKSRIIQDMFQTFALKAFAFIVKI